MRYQTASKLGRHYNFDVWVNGVYQPQRALVVTTNPEQQVVRVFKSVQDTQLRNGQALVAAEIESPRTLEAKEPPALSSGSLLDVTVSLFDPDLRTMQQQAAPETVWSSLDEYPQAVEYVEKSIQVLQADGQLYLANPRVKQVDAQALLAVTEQGGEPVRDSGDFLAPEGVEAFPSIDALQSVRLGDDAFPQLMAFYHLDSSLRYLASLNYTLFREPLRFDARGLAKDNSSYYYGPRAVMFGIGGASPDAIDADVIRHELGHGIHYQIVPTGLMDTQERLAKGWETIGQAAPAIVSNIWTLLVAVKSLRLIPYLIGMVCLACAARPAACGISARATSKRPNTPRT